MHACTDKYFYYAFFEWYHPLKQDYRALNLVKRNSSIRTNPVVLLEYHISVNKLALVGVQLRLTVFLCVYAFKSWSEIIACCVRVLNSFLVT